MTGHVFQHYDYFVRNPIFATLVRCDWPLSMPDGSDFIYYLASWLPPALVARIHPVDSFPFYCLGAWCLVGTLLMCLLMEKKLGRRTLLFLLFLTFSGSMNGWRFLPSTMRFGNWLFLQIGEEPAYQLLRYFITIGSFLQLHTTFHHVIPVWIVLALYFSGALSWHHAVCASAFVFLTSPLGSVGLGVFFLFVLIADRDKTRERIVSLFREPALYSGCLLAVIAAAYFLSSKQGGSFYWLWEKLGNYSLPQIGLSFFLMLGLPLGLFFILAALMKQQQNKLVWFVLGMLALLPLFFVGIVNNELSFKASCVAYWIMALLLVQWFDRADWKRRICIIVFVLLCSTSLIPILKRCYYTIQNPHSSNLKADWQWHLYHPQDDGYPQFEGKIRLPQLFYTKAGASAETLLSWCRCGNRSDSELLPPPTPWKGCPIPTEQRESCSSGQIERKAENSPESAL